MRRFRVLLAETSQVIGEGAELPDEAVAIFYYGTSTVLYEDGIGGICTTGRLAHRVEWIDDQPIPLRDVPPDYRDQLSDVLEDASDCRPDVWMPMRDAVLALLGRWGIHQVVDSDLSPALSTPRG